MRTAFDAAWDSDFPEKELTLNNRTLRDFIARSQKYKKRIIKPADFGCKLSKKFVSMHMYKTNMAQLILIRSSLVSLSHLVDQPPTPKPQSLTFSSRSQLRSC